jgi:hypothetical protein
VWPKGYSSRRRLRKEQHDDYVRQVYLAHRAYKSTPCPIYATRGLNGGSGPYHTCNPYEAAFFPDEEAAFEFMKAGGYFFPWKPVYHGFIGLGHVDD